MVEIKLHKILTKNILLVALIAFVIIICAWWLPNIPQKLNFPYHDKVQSLSFTPYFGRQSPMTTKMISSQQMTARIKLIAPITKGIRLYTSLGGMEQVPEIAETFNLTVTAAAWIGPIAAYNQQEITSLIKLANQYPQTIKQVIVGNETILRGESSVDQLKDYIAQVKSQIKQPVTYADVWEIWLDYPELAGVVDIITIHILPYWENDPVSVENANQHINMILTKIKNRFPGKAIMIGEIGWPTHGRYRGVARTGLIESASFLENFLNLIKQNDISYNIVEAFDQPWKSQLEGRIGANWGIYTTKGEAKFTLNDTIMPQPWWRKGMTIAAIFTIFFLMIIAKKTIASWQAVISLGFFIAAISYSLSYVIIESWLFTYGTEAQLIALAKNALALIFCTIILLCTINHENNTSRKMLMIGAGLYVFLLTYSAWESILIITDGRYRDFPTIYLLPVAVVLFGSGLYSLINKPKKSLGFFSISYILASDKSKTTPPYTAKCLGLLAVIIIAIAIALIYNEGASNLQSLWWAGQMLIMALSLVASNFYVKLNHDKTK